MLGWVEALCEVGEGFEVRTSWGSVLVPDEASNGAAALVLADQRMYAHKGSAGPRPNSKRATSSCTC